MPNRSAAALAAGGVIAGCAVASAAWAVRGRSSSVFGPSVWRGIPTQAKTGHKTIALTFDDGPSPATPAFLEVLAEYALPATFFQIGANVKQHPDIARAVLSAGHEIGNHSHSHLNFALRSPALIDGDFTRAQQTIGEVTGAQPVLLRAPFGVRWFGFREMQAKLGLMGVMWTVIGLDWKLPATGIAERVIAGACDGGIICLHDGRGLNKHPDVTPALEAVRRLIPALLQAGYHFETVSQLLCPKT